MEGLFFVIVCCTPNLYFSPTQCQFMCYIIEFLLGCVVLTKKIRLRLVWILNPEVLRVLASRAVFAKAFLLPVMKKANSLGKKNRNFIL